MHSLSKSWSFAHCTLRIYQHCWLVSFFKKNEALVVLNNVVGGRDKNLFVSSRHFMWQVYLYCFHTLLRVRAYSHNIQFSQGGVAMFSYSSPHKIIISFAASSLNLHFLLQVCSFHHILHKYASPHDILTLFT